MPITESNATIVAQFNPGIFTERWLVRIKAAKDSDFIPGAVSICTPAASQFQLRTFDLMVIPDRFQLAPKGNPEGWGDVVKKKVLAIVETLRALPYVAVGFNFHSRYACERGSLSTLSRRLFLNEAGPFAAEFSSADAKFGAILTRLTPEIFDGSNVLLTMAPGRQDDSEFINFHFNFNLDLNTDKPSSAIRQFVAKWDEARHFADRMLAILESKQ